MCISSKYVPYLTEEEVERQSTSYLVSRGQTAFFRFYLWWRKKGSGLVHTRISSSRPPLWWGVIIEET